MKNKHLIPFAGILAFLVLLTGARSAEAYTHTVTLRLGSNNSQVLELQRALNSVGYRLAAAGAGSPGYETTYFGSLTRAAVMRFQWAQHLGVDGIVGPMTGGRLAALTAGTPTPTPTPPVVVCPIGYTCTPISNPKLSGQYGTINNVSSISSYSNEEVGSGEDNVRIAGFTVEASNSGDIALRAIRISFDPSGSTGSKRLDRYIDSVSIWQGDTKLATADASDFSRNSNDVYEDTIDLNADNAIVRSNKTEPFYITVSAASNIDSADLSGDSWSVAVDSIRYVDGSGVVSTDSSTGDLGSMNVPINFVSFSNAANTELRISTANDTPQSGIVTINGSRQTDNVSLLKGELRLSGSSDVTIDELPVTVTVSGTASDVNNVVSDLTLRINGKTYTEIVPNTASASVTVPFNDMNLRLRAGDTVSFEVLGTINSTSNGSFAEGDTIKVDVTAANRAAIDVENSRGDQLSSGELTGTAIGNVLQLRSNGLALSYVSSDASVLTESGSNNDRGQFNIRFKVSAIGSDIYIPAGTANGVTYTVDRAGTAVASGTQAVLQSNSNLNTTANGNYRIPEGTEASFTLSVFTTLPDAGTSGLYRASLTGIKWDTTDTNSPANTYTFNLDQFRTVYISLN